LVAGYQDAAHQYWMAKPTFKENPTRIRLTTVSIFAAVAAAISAAPAAASRSCGALPGGPVRRAVTIYRGSLSCGRARSVAKSYAHGTFHGPVNGPRSAQYVTIPGGWRCSVIEQGGAGCVRGGSRSNPREQIGFIVD
jgi:hypothetical protein